LEIESIDSHISSAPTTTANLNPIQNPKGAFLSSPDLRSLQAHPSIGKDSLDQHPETQGIELRQYAR
jgi:hypothetical protein